MNQIDIRYLGYHMMYVYDTSYFIRHNNEY